MSQDNHYRNDVYGKVDDRSEEDAGVVPAIPAATVVLLRDRDDGPEVLMLRKNSKITFGGMWVFPGGRIDPADYPANGDLQAAARAAAAREATEEANVYLSADDFVWFAHWTPPPSPRKRFATSFSPRIRRMITMSASTTGRSRIMPGFDRATYWRDIAQAKSTSSRLRG